MCVSCFVEGESGLLSAVPRKHQYKYAGPPQSLSIIVLHCGGNGDRWITSNPTHSPPHTPTCTRTTWTIWCLTQMLLRIKSSCSGTSPLRIGQSWCILTSCIKHNQQPSTLKTVTSTQPKAQKPFYADEYQRTTDTLNNTRLKTSLAL